MKIKRYAIINDEDTTTYMGGAALVNEKIQQRLISDGNQCDIILINNSNRENDIPKEWYSYDYYIFANIGYCPYKFLNKIMDTKPFITFRHDIPILLYSRPKSIFFKSFYDTWGKMFEKAKAAFFISPMQAEIFKTTFNLPLYAVIPPPLNLKGFENKNNLNRKGSLYVGDINESRGCSQTLGIMKGIDKDGPYTFVGKITDKDCAKYLVKEGATVLDAVVHEKIPEIMNKHHTLYYFPKIYDSFCLKIVEAALCGMKLQADTLCIGCFSYKKPIEDMKEEIETKSLDFIIKTMYQETPKSKS